ncbi:MAG: type II toxin-antitoxin system HicB family antitoxin [Defluviitaleaceae bacterium]|nr:type II toxin-antitoxin system HicB family antitoxin [Defluviitaleaceae bacterium]MCL2239465.1 type II toxin-antitoxin system HicB family antitoxin [Defluviitaleaceae bacterium]
MRYVYPAILRLEGDKRYFVFFPDLQRGATQGDTLADAISMAEDSLCLALYDMEESGDIIPAPSKPRELEIKNEDMVTLVSVDTEDYRRYYDNKLVKKTLNIPSWLNKRAEEANINFSQTLQTALKHALRIAQ